MDKNQRTGSASGSADSSLPPWNGSQQGSTGPIVSLVIPACNAQETIAQAIREADQALATLDVDYEILIVDDGSTDATAEIAAHEATLRSAVKVLRQSQSLGFGAALRRGFTEAKAPLVGYTNAQCEFDLLELDRLLLLSEDYEVISGYRIDRKGAWPRRIASAAYNLVVRVLWGVRVRDCNCALKLFRKEFLESNHVEADGIFVHAELLAKARMQPTATVEVGVTQRAPAAKRNKISPRHMATVASEMSRFWWSNLFEPGTPDEAHRSTGAWSPKMEAVFMSLLIVVAIFGLFGRLSYPLFEPDESRYAQIAMEMIQSDDWVTPTLEGNPYLDKPPLLYWATAASYGMFGLNEWAARFPSAVGVFLTWLATYFLGRRIIGGRAASFGAAALLMCGGFMLSGRFVLMDGPLAFFTTVAMLTGYLACARSEMRIGWWVVFSLACALGTMTKGPVTLLLTVPPLLAVLWLSNSLRRIQFRHWLIMAAIIALVTLPWFVAISIVNDEFILYFFWKHNVVRFLDAFQHEEPWWYYVPIMLAGTFPSSLLLPSLIAFLRLHRKADAPRNSQATGYLMLGALWVVFFFSLSSCKLPTYILPAFPPLSLVLGMVLDQSVFAERGHFAASVGYQWLPKRLALSAVILATVAIVVVRVLFPEMQLGLTFCALSLIAGGAMLQIVWKTATTRANVAWASSLAFSLGVMGFVLYGFVPALSQSRSIHAKVAELQRQHPTAPLIYFAHQTYAAALYLDLRHVLYYNSKELEQVGRFLQEHEEVILVTIPRTVQRLESSFGEEIELQPLDSRGHLFISHQHTPSVARVSAAAPYELH